MKENKKNYGKYFYVLILNIWSWLIVMREEIKEEAELRRSGIKEEGLD